MRIKVIGRLRQDYTLDNGYTFHGVKYFGEVLDDQREGLEGHMVTDLKISDTSPLAMNPMQVGATYIVYFNQKGAVDFLQPDNSAAGFDVFVDDKKK
jgi:hypothetical protein